MIYFAVFVAWDPNSEEEHTLHLLVEAVSVPAADAAFKVRLRALWDDGGLESRFSVVHVRRLAEMALAPRAAVCVHREFTTSGHEPVFPAREDDVRVYMPEDDGEHVATFLDRKESVPPVRWRDAL